MDLRDIPIFTIVEDDRCLQACLWPMTGAQKRVHKRMCKGARTIIKCDIGNGHLRERRPVLVKGIRYESIDAAAKALGMTPGAVRHRISRGTVTYAD